MFARWNPLTAGMPRGPGGGWHNRGRPATNTPASAGPGGLGDKLTKSLLSSCWVSGRTRTRETPLGAGQVITRPRAGDCCWRPLGCRLRLAKPPGLPLVTGTSVHDRSVSRESDCAFFGGIPASRQGLAGNRARRCAPRIDPGLQPLTRNLGKSNAAGNRTHPCLQGPRAKTPPTALRLVTVDGHQLVCCFFLLKLEAIPTFVGLFSTKLQETSQAPSGEPENRVSDTSGKGRLHTSAKGHRVMCAKGACSPSGSCRERKYLQENQRGRASSAMSNSALCGNPAGHCGHDDDA